MLPGFRFLFAAIALSISILVFGLGAAALLRAAHEEFASNSSWRAAPEQPMIARQSEPAKPVLAMLRFDPPHPAAKAPEPAASQETSGARAAEATTQTPPAEQNAVVAPAAEGKTLAALETKDTAPAVETKTEDPPVAAAVANDAKPTPLVIATDAPAKAEEVTPAETKVAAVDAAKPSASETPSAPDGAGTPEMTKPEPVNMEPVKVEAAKVAPASSEAVNIELAASEPAKEAVKPEPTVAAPPTAINPAAVDPPASRIATLGGPAVTIEDLLAKQAEEEKAERSAKAQRRAEAREKARRRAAARARLARRQALLAQRASQLTADPFAAVAAQAPTARQPARTPRPAQ